jgi:uncharacterized protein
MSEPEIDPFAEAMKRRVSFPKRKQHGGIVTSHLLYDVVACEHRVMLDITTDVAPGAVNAFVELLWRRESQYTTKVYELMRQWYPGALDLSQITDYGVRANRTINALHAQTPAILGGLLDVENLRAEPNFLMWDGSYYRVGIIKSGRGREQRREQQEVEEVLKAHYAVELALSIDALERLAVPVWRIGEVYDVNGDRVPYDLSAGYRSHRTFWQWYEQNKARVMEILGGDSTEPAYTSMCKLCHWHDHCLKSLLADDDITLVYELGRSRRKILRDHAETREELASCDPADWRSIVSDDNRRSMYEGLFRLLLARAKLVVDGRVDPSDGHPYLAHDGIVGLHHFDRDDIFFDVETDPMRDVCYLHGFAERLRGEQDFSYTSFFAEPDQERDAFVQAVAYLRERPEHVIYHYSPYEKTIYRRLQTRFPDVCSEKEIEEEFFAKRRCVDLYYDVVYGQSIWPTIDHSLKTLAKSEFVGFKWADPNPSGAASVEWFDRWMTERDSAWKDRILVYNKDDCIGMAYLLDAMRKFPIRPIGTPAIPNTLAF